MVWDLQADTCVYERNATTVMRPASTMKLLTAVAALRQMGDSSAVRADMKGEQLRADFSMKDTVALGEGWCWDDNNPQLATRDTTIAMHPLGWLLWPMLKQSNNLAAEAVFYNLAAYCSNIEYSNKRRSVSSKTAQHCVEQFIQQLACDTPWLELSSDGTRLYRVADGSGLSLYNYVTPQLLTACLRHAWHDESLRRRLLACLPIAGYDGTLEHRMQGTEAEWLVAAKTGTLSGVSSLAGYCLPRTLAFTIICNGTMRQQPARDLQDALCIEMAK